MRHYKTDTSVKHSYTGYIEPCTPGDTIRYGSVEAKPTERCTLPVTLFPYASGSDYVGGLVERSNYRVLAADPHVMRRSVLIEGGYGTFGIAFIGYPTRRIRELCDSLDGYPLLDDSDHSELEMETVNKEWADWGRSDFARELQDTLDRLDPDHEHTVERDDRSLDMLWYDGCEVFNVNGGSGYVNEQGDSIHFYISEWLESAEGDPTEYEIQRGADSWSVPKRHEMRARLLAYAYECRDSVIAARIPTHSGCVW